MTLSISRLGLALILSAAAVSAGAQPDRGTMDDTVTAGDIAVRVERALRADDANARTWYAGLTHLDHWTARLERSLLEILGPAEIQDPDHALEQLERLARGLPDNRRLEPGARTTLRVVTDLLARLTDSSRERQQLSQALAREREAHLRTLEKLAALREIDEELDAREREPDGGDR